MAAKIIKVLTLLSITLILAACGGMADIASRAGGVGVITEDQSTFDGAQVIEVSPAWLYDPDRSGWNTIQLGARWVSGTPDFVALILSYRSDASGYSETYLGLDSIAVNIDGEVTQYEAGQPANLSSSGYNSVTNTIYTQSSNSVVVPTDIVERMISADDVRLRISSSSGYEDSVFTIERMPGGQGTAIRSIREFMERVNSVR